MRRSRFVLVFIVASFSFADSHASALAITPASSSIRNTAGANATSLTNVSLPFSSTLADTDGATTATSSVSITESSVSVTTSLFATNDADAVSSLGYSFFTDAPATYTISGALFTTASTAITRVNVSLSGASGTPYALIEDNFNWFQGPNPSWDLTAPISGSSTGVLLSPGFHTVSFTFGFLTHFQSPTNNLSGSGSFFFDLQPAEIVPEPTSGTLLALSLLWIAIRHRRHACA